MWIRFDKCTEKYGIHMINTKNLADIYREDTNVICNPLGIAPTTSNAADTIACESEREAEYVIQAICTGIKDGTKVLDVDEVLFQYRLKKGWLEP